MGKKISVYRENDVEYLKRYLLEAVREVLLEGGSAQQSLNESAETIGADINEIWFAYLAAGSSWSAVGDGAAAKKQLEERVKTLQGSESKKGEADEYIKMQQGRAEATLEAVKGWVAGHETFSGDIAKSYWTAREGTLAAVVNDGKPKAEHVEVNQAGSGGNPTDVALKLSTGDVLGVSLKSTSLKSGKISFKAGGFASTVERLKEFGVKPNFSAGENVLGQVDWKSVQEAAIEFVTKDLPTALFEADDPKAAKTAERAKERQAAKARRKEKAPHAQEKAQSNKVRKQFVQMLQYFGLPKEERDAMLLKKYRNQAKADAKKEEYSDWARYLQKLMPPEELGGGSFEDYAKKQYQDQKDVGNKVLGKARDIILDGLNQLKKEERSAFILKEYVNATAITPYWIKATGIGDSPPYSAKVKDPHNDPRYAPLTSGDITFETVAGGTIGVKAAGQQIMTIRAKWESAPIITSIKTDTKDW